MRTAELAAGIDRLPNRPATPDLAAALDPALLTAWLDMVYASHRAASVALCDRYERFLVATKDGITTEHVAGVATDFREQVKAGISDTDATRTKIKRPVLEASRIIDGEAKKITALLEAILPVIEQRIAAFLAAKAEREKREAEQEAQRLAAAAQEALRLADMGAGEDEAVAALEAAQEAEARATASLPELSRVRSVHNSVAGLQDNWVWETVDVDAIPRHLMMPNDKAIELSIKQGAREIAGLRVYNQPKLYSRKSR